MAIGKVCWMNVVIDLSIINVLVLFNDWDHFFKDLIRCSQNCILYEIHFFNDLRMSLDPRMVINVPTLWVPK